MPLVIGSRLTGCVNAVPVSSPWSGRTVATVAQVDAASVTEALDGAARYAVAPLDEQARAELLDRWAALVERDLEPIAAGLSAENGKTLGEARAEVTRTAGTVRSYAQAARELNAAAHAVDFDPEAPPLPDFVTHHRPLGTVIAYTPYNFPANTPAHKLGSAIAAGNAVILKPSEKAPATALRLGYLLCEAGAPPGMLSILCGDPVALSEQLLGDRRAAAFSMTGHSAVGAALYRRWTASGGFRPIHLELGGNGAQIVLDDIDPVACAHTLADAVFAHAGARCTTPRRIMVPAGAWHERFVAAAVARSARYRLGDPSAPDTTLGSLIDREAAQVCADRVREAAGDGAVVRAGGECRGAGLEATVLDRVRPGMRIVTEENFGPVMSIMPYDSLDEAIRWANASDYALQPAVMSADIAAASAVAARLQGGCVNVGPRACTSDRSDTVPFGGYGLSGLGVEGGVAGVRELTRAVRVKFLVAS